MHPKVLCIVKTTMLYFNFRASLSKYGSELSSAATLFVHVSKADMLKILNRIQISLGLK